MSTMCTITVRVLSSGPPGDRGMIQGWSKRRNARIEVTVMTKMRGLRIPGSVTFLNCCHWEAPSMDAAS